MALLHALARSGFTRLVVCHLDHAWRPESAEEAEFVHALASSYGVDFETERCASAPVGEAAARHARYSFFARIAAQRQCPRVLLAHHADDQVETFLFNLLRGAGGPGLAGMQPLSRRVIDGIELEIARPLLGCWREEIDAYVTAERLDFREDPSNADPRHARNRLRHEILPALAAAVGRPVRGNLWKAAAILSGENDYFAQLPELQNPPSELDTRAVRALPLALQRRLIHTWLSGHGIESIGFEEVEAVRSLLVQESPAKVNLPGHCHARRRAGRLFIERPPG